MSLSVMFSNSSFQQNNTYPWVYFFHPIWRGDINFMQPFFPNCGNPARPRSRTNPVLCGFGVHSLWYCSQNKCHFLFPFTCIRLCNNLREQWEYMQGYITGLFAFMAKISYCMWIDQEKPCQFYPPMTLFVAVHLSNLDPHSIHQLV